MASDLLATLQARLAKERSVAAEANRNIDDLETAIAALAGKRTAVTPPREATPSIEKPRRGEVMRVALDCIRSGKGTPALIRKECIARGVKITDNSVSNVLQRLKLSIRLDLKEKRYFMRNSEDVEMAPRARLVRDLQDSLDAEGSKVVTLKPSIPNGAAAQTA